MIPFQKFQGTGNDFIIFNFSDVEQYNLNVLAQNVCNRHFGIGADGMIISKRSDIADIKMDFFNADGSIATMCGNGIRCFAKFVYENEIIKKNKFNVETLAGIMKVEVFEKNNLVDLVRVNLGKPLFSSKEIPKASNSAEFINEEIVIEDERLKISSIFIGTIHTVLFVKEFDYNYLEKIGRYIENHKIFPFKTNVNFCKRIDKNNIEVLTWEKGVGFTLACGTGAAACFVINRLINNSDNQIQVKVNSGSLYFEEVDEDILMSGPAKLICKGNYNY